MKEEKTLIQQALDFFRKNQFNKGLTLLGEQIEKNKKEGIAFENLDLISYEIEDYLSIGREDKAFSTALLLGDDCSFCGNDIREVDEEVEYNSIDNLKTECFLVSRYCCHCGKTEYFN